MDGKHSLHGILIGQAREAGWHTGPWKQALRNSLQAADTIERLRGVLSEPSLQGQLEDLAAMVGEFACIPDAWRISIEGAEKGWRHPVIAVELLEVEVTSHVGDDKMRQLESLFWMFDATEIAHLRVFRMDRFGIVSPLMTEETAQDVSHRFGTIDRQLGSE